MTAIILSLVLIVPIAMPAAAMATQAPPPDFAQGQPNPRPPGGGGPLPGLDNGDMTPGEIQKLFDAYLVMEAQQALELSDQQYPQFLARLRTLQETRRKNLQERNQMMAQLQRISNPRLPTRAEDAQIKERLTALQELESRNAAEMRKAYNGVDEVLNVMQQARFRVFEEAIERRKIELLMRARQPNNRPRPQQEQ
jgi:hypothetical protein